jgi:hypothetical protein
MSNAIAAMKNLDEELRAELQLKKVLTRNNLFPQLNPLAKLNALLEEIQDTTRTLMTWFTTNLLDIKETESLANNSPQRDVYGGLGFFTPPDLESVSSPTLEDSLNEMKEKK